MTIEEKKQEIEACFEDASEKTIALTQALIKLRSIELPKMEKEEDIQPILELANELNTRTAYLLRALLVQHGNVLFI